MNDSKLVVQMKKNKTIAEQLTFLLQTDENAKKAYEDESFAIDFLEDLHRCSLTQLIQAYYHKGLSTYFGKSTIPLKTLSSMIIEVDVSRYQGNAYYQTIQWPTLHQGEWSFDWGVYPAYQLFLIGDVQVDANKAYAETTPLAFSRQPFLYPCLLKKDSIWMSVTPFEIETMQHVILAATGDVLTLGCGMGYVAFMMSEKVEVHSVTIVDNDLNVLKMFEDHILPQFPHRHKIKLVHQDALVYVDNTMISTRYTMVFADIYQTVEDGLPLYLELKKREHKQINIMQWHYWLEESMIAMIRRQILLKAKSKQTLNDYNRQSILALLMEGQTT